MAADTCPQCMTIVSSIDATSISESNEYENFGDGRCRKQMRRGSLF